MLTLTPAGERHVRQFRQLPLVQTFVYWNLHKHCWSIKATEGVSKGLVIAHADSLVITQVHPKVSEAGRRRVISEGCKNVHAGLIGFLSLKDPDGSTLRSLHDGSQSLAQQATKPLAYNPRDNQTFIYGLTGETYFGSYCAVMTANNGRASVKV